MIKTIEKTCLCCAKTFSADLREHKRGNAKFCSRSCSASYNSRERIPEKINNTACAFCGKEFYRNSSKKAKSKHSIYFCCRKHKDLAQRLGGIKEIQPPHYSPDSITICTYRRVAIGVYGEVCNRCGYKENALALQVHHKDCNRSNNEITNLEVLCANCHCIEHLGK